jgi:hypothetical protein
MSRTAKQAVALGFLTFVTLWIIGFARAITLEHPEPTTWNLSSGEDYASASQSLSRAQAANNVSQLGLAKTPLPALLELPAVEQVQVYEKFAQLAAGSEIFEDDEVRLRGILADYNAVILNERSTGIAPSRRITLEVGVKPEEFDAIVDRLRQIGHLDSISVQRRDRTGEFRKLNAQRQSLKKHLDAIQQLRTNKNASFDDQLRLEQKVQDIEKDMQTLGVQLGDLLGKESYYQVYTTLYEYQPGGRLDHTFSLPQRMAHAFVWAAARWLAIAAFAGTVLGVAISVRTLVRRSPTA